MENAAFHEKFFVSDRRKGSFIMNTVSETIDSNPNITVSGLLW